MDSSSGIFPFLRLPLVAQILVLECMNLGELFDFALLSKKCRELVSGLHLKVARISWMMRCGERNWYKLEIRKDQFAPTFELKFTIPIEEKNKKPSGSIDLNGTVATISRSYHSNSTIMNCGEERCGRNYYLKVMEELTKTILDLFTAEKYNVELHEWPYIPNCFLWRMDKLKRFDEIRLQPGGQRILGSYELKFVLRRLRMDQFSQEGPTVLGLNFTGPLRMRVLEVGKAVWLREEAFLKMKCEVVRVQTDSLDHGKLNGLLKAWVAGEGMKKLKQLSVNVTPNVSRDGGWDRRLSRLEISSRLSRILNGIETKPQTPVTSYSRFKDSIGFDICRHDGTTASVLFTTDKLTEFYMIVHRGSGVHGVVEESEEEEIIETDSDKDSSSEEDSENESDDEDESEEEEEAGDNDVEETAKPPTAPIQLEKEMEKMNINE